MKKCCRESRQHFLVLTATLFSPSCALYHPSDADGFVQQRAQRHVAEGMADHDPSDADLSKNFVLVLVIMLGTMLGTMLGS